MTDTLTITRSLARRVFVADVPHNMVAEDWPTIELANAAAEKACQAITRGHVPCPRTGEEWDWLADCIIKMLHVDPTTFGCSLVVEPALPPRRRPLAAPLMP